MKKLLSLVLAMCFAALAPAAEAAILVDAYTAATTAKTATAAGTAPFFSICGAASLRTIRVLQVVVGGTVAAATYGDIVLTKTSTATSGGTATALTATPQDSNSRASAAALVNYYTVLPTAGAATGKVASQTAVFPLTGTVAASAANVVFDWSPTPDKAPVLRGSTQCLEASFGTTTSPNAPTLTVQVLWTEEQ